jgi:membrane glycosyltransferase
MRRAGWEVHLVPSVEGSYEGCPPTVSDLIVRDRRWAQGNLQHLRLLHTQGLPFLSRLHLAMGAVAYLSSATWALTLLVGVVLAIQASYTLPTYFGSEDTLFPNWPVFDAQTALVLFIATVLVVHLPKILGGFWALSTAQRRRENGGVMRVMGGIVLESVLSTLLAPVLMLTQTGAVLSILLLRRDAGWGAQRRVSGTASLMDFLVQHRWQMAWGAAGAVITWMVSPAVFAWMSPITLGLLLAPLLSLWVAKEASGAVARLLSTRDDLHIPAVLSDRQQLQSEWHHPAPLPASRAAE